MNKSFAQEKPKGNNELDPNQVNNLIAAAEQPIRRNFPVVGTPDELALMMIQDINFITAENTWERYFLRDKIQVLNDGVQVLTQEQVVVDGMDGVYLGQKMSEIKDKWHWEYPENLQLNDSQVVLEQSNYNSYDRLSHVGNKYHPDWFITTEDSLVVAHNANIALHLIRPELTEKYLIKGTVFGLYTHPFQGGVYSSDDDALGFTIAAFRDQNGIEKTLSLVFQGGGVVNAGTVLPGEGRTPFSPGSNNTTVSLVVDCYKWGDISTPWNPPTPNSMVTVKSNLLKSGRTYWNHNDINLYLVDFVLERNGNIISYSCRLFKEISPEITLGTVTETFDLSLDPATQIFQGPKKLGVFAISQPGGIKDVKLIPDPDIYYAPLGAHIHYDLGTDSYQIWNYNTEVYDVFDPSAEDFLDENVLIPQEYRQSTKDRINAQMDISQVRNLLLHNTTLNIAFHKPIDSESDFERHIELEPSKLEKGTLQINTDDFTLTAEHRYYGQLVYNGNGGTITIETGFIILNRTTIIEQGGTSVFTLVGGTGVTLKSPGDKFSTSAQNECIGLFAKNATTVVITGATAT